MMDVNEGRTRHLDARNVHVSDPQGFEDALADLCRKVRALQVKEDAQILAVDGQFSSSEERDPFTSDLDHAIAHASQRLHPPRTAIGRALSNLSVKLDRNVQDVSTPQHPGADTTQP